MSDKDKPTPKMGADSMDPKRDARGRWRKGHCPNPKGRPRKVKFEGYNPSDIRHFANTQIELMMNGEPVKLDRRAALLNKSFESAMKGRVSQQRYLLQLFEKNDVRLAEMRHRYNTLLHRWVLDNPNFKGFDESLSREQQLELLSLASTLNHYHPGQYEELLRPFIESDDADEG